jgi:hypothetical protein
MTVTAGVQLEKTILVVSFKGPVVKTNWLGVYRQSQSDSDYNSELFVESVESCRCDKWEAGSWGRGQFGNPEEGQRPPLEAATKQRLVKTAKTVMCTVVTVILGVCNWVRLS